VFNFQMSLIIFPLKLVPIVGVRTCDVPQSQVIFVVVL
jgi:hypothetical protein